MTLLSDKILDKAWKEWNEIRKSNYYDMPYSRVARRAYMAQLFENWLFTEGATVQRINKKCYLQFSNEEDAVIFRLKYS